jgi:hypothetical protein
MPANPKLVCNSYFHCSAECYSVFADVVGAEFSNAIVFHQVHQLTVDTYAVQHAGPGHPDKSVTLHLAGLHAAFDLKQHPSEIPGLLQRLAGRVERWPHFLPPSRTGSMDIFAVAIADTTQQHIERVRKWASMVWEAWSAHHAAIKEFVRNHR